MSLTKGVQKSNKYLVTIIKLKNDSFVDKLGPKV